MAGSYYMINAEYRRALSLAETELGFPLTLIEKVELKHIMSDAVDLYGHQTLNEWTDFCIYKEAAYRFLAQNYGFPIDIVDQFYMNIDREKTQIRIGYDWYSSYWRQMQDQMHFL